MLSKRNFNHIIKEKIVQYFCVVKPLEMTSARKFTIPKRGGDLVETTLFKCNIQIHVHTCSNVTFHFHTSAIFKLDHKNVESKDVHTDCM